MGRLAQTLGVMNDIELIRKIAMQLRKAIQTTDASKRPPLLVNFPRGACGWSSLLLGAAFIDHGIHGFLYTSGERLSLDRERWVSHSWLQGNGLIVDLTSDQFPDGLSEFVLSDQSKWHSQFEPTKSSPADFRISLGPPEFDSLRR